MPYCPECGNRVGKGSAFCSNCGESLSARDTEAVEAHDRDLTAESAPPETPTTTGPSDSSTTAAKEHERSESGGTLQGRFWLNSVIGGTVGFMLGAVITTAFFPIYFLGIIAGAFLAGVFHDLGAGPGAKVGAVAGFLATIPFLFFVVGILVLGVGWFTAAGMPTHTGGDVFAGLSIVAVFLSVFGLFVNMLAGVFGGLIGGMVGEN